MLATASFEAIGVINQITVGDADALGDALAIARARLADLDLACSRFRDDSELAALNQAGTATVSPLLLEAIVTALDAAARTGGLVDPTVGAALRRIGYDRDLVVVRRGDGGPLLSARPAPGWRAVEVDRARAAVRLPEGAELDLGATAKALAADLIAGEIEDACRTAVLVSLGGDIAVRGVPQDGAWQILVTDDARGGDGQVVAIRGGGLATSSTTVRRWRAGGVEHHHIVDPRTGSSVEPVWRTVSVAAASCTDANTASTAAIVLGAMAPVWLERHRLAARLVRPDGRTVSVGGWPEEIPADAQESLGSLPDADGQIRPWATSG